MGGSSDRRGRTCCGIPTDPGLSRGSPSTTPPVLGPLVNLGALIRGTGFYSTYRDKASVEWGRTSDFLGDGTTVYKVYVIQ